MKCPRRDELKRLVLLEQKSSSLIPRCSAWVASATSWRGAQDMSGCLHAGLCQGSTGLPPGPSPRTAGRSFMPGAELPEPASWSEFLDSVLKGKVVHHTANSKPHRAALHLSKTKQTKYITAFLTAAKHHLERIGNYCFV